MRILALLAGWSAIAPVWGSDPAPSKTDRYGDPLPAGAVARLGFLRSGTGMPLNVTDGRLAVFSPDGRWFATACHDRIHVWDLASGKVVRRFSSPAIPLRQLAFADQGKTLLALTAKRLLGWNLATGRVMPPKIGKDYLWGNSQLSPKGKWLVDAQGGLRNLRTGKKSGGMEKVPVDKGLAGATFSPDERRLYLVLRDRIKGRDTYDLQEWDPAVGQRLRTFDGFEGSYLACSPDGDLLAASLRLEDPQVVNKFSFTIVVWDLAAGREVLRLPEESTHFETPAFSPDGKRFAAVRNRDTLQVWETATGKLLRTWTYRREHLNQIAFSPDGRWIGTCGAMGTALLWNVSTGQPRFLNEPTPYAISDLLFRRDGKQLVVGHGDGSLLVWDLAGKKVVREHHFGGESPAYSVILDLAWDPSGALLFRSHQTSAGELRLLDSASGKATTLSLGPGVDIQAVAPVGRTLVVGPVPAGKQEMRRQPLSAEQVDAARKKLGTRSDLEGYRILVPPPATEKARNFLGMPGKGDMTVPTRVVAVSPEGKYLVETVSTLAGSPFTGMGVYWAVRNRRLVDAMTGRIVREFTGKYEPSAFSPDGRELLVLDATRNKQVFLALVESRTGRERRRFPLDGPIRAAEFSPCGRRLAVIDESGKDLIVLDARSGDRLCVYRTDYPDRGTDRMAFAPGGGVVARAQGDGTVLLWQVPADARQPTEALSPAEVAAAWRELGSDDAAAAFRAIHHLAAGPDRSLPLLRKELLQEIDSGRIERLVADLHSAEFVVRQRAMQGLESIGPRVRPYLAKALRPDTPLEPRRRLEKLLASLADPFATATGLRQLRGVEVLERIGSEEARRLLTAIAADGREDPLGQEALFALERLGR